MDKRDEDSPPETPKQRARRLLQQAREIDDRRDRSYTLEKLSPEEKEYLRKRYGPYLGSRIERFIFCRRNGISVPWADHAEGDYVIATKYYTNGFPEGYEDWGPIKNNAVLLTAICPILFFIIMLILHAVLSL